MPMHSQPSEPDLLQRVTVRLLHGVERARFDRALEQQHYLASARLAGQTLRYVAELDGQWVTKLDFSSSCFCNRLNSGHVAAVLNSPLANITPSGKSTFCNRCFWPLENLPRAAPR